jgi:2-keto-4-pentenoate hydratase/2-oxohepta-3-ene-1,7-dioic acid hydratase in catechol pathway
MLLVKFSPVPSGPMRTGIAVDGVVYDVSSKYGSIATFLSRHPDGWNKDILPLDPYQQFDHSEVKLGPPVDDGASVYLVGANYKKHAEEAGLDVPQTPVIFQKPITALLGPTDPIVIPPVSTQMDFEGELAVMIGRTARRVSAVQAKHHVAGLTVLNDVTARDLQWVQLGKHRIVDWLSSKALDQSTPVGPGVASVSAVTDPHRLRLRTRLNEDLMQDADTSLMVFSIWQLIEFLSARATLRPGDLLSTGTPVGVGGFRKIFLKQGDRVRVEIEEIGMLDNPVVAI